MMSNKFCLNIEALIFNFFYEVALKYFDNLVTKKMIKLVWEVIII